jgi:protein-tyrosine-phosphatase
MKKIVFICHGNIFRSQVARGFYNKFKKDDSIAYGYGTDVINRGLQGLKLSQKLGLEIVITEMKKYDIDMSDEHCEQLKEEYLKDADNVIVMSEKEYIPDWLQKYKYEYWEILNPEAHTKEVVKEIIELIKNKVIKLIG